MRPRAGIAGSGTGERWTTCIAKSSSNTTRTPPTAGIWIRTTISFADDNPLCGDHIQIDLRVDENNKITDARFDGHGCAISQASADLLIESVIGKSVEDVKP